MNHLVQRLREKSRLGYWPLLGDEAADEIERLQAEPQQRRPLTDAQIDEVTREQWGKQFDTMLLAHRTFARAIERAHGITGEQK